MPNKASKKSTSRQLQASAGLADQEDQEDATSVFEQMQAQKEKKTKKFGNLRRRRSLSPSRFSKAAGGGGDGMDAAAIQRQHQSTSSIAYKSLPQWKRWFKKQERKERKQHKKASKTIVDDPQDPSSHNNENEESSRSLHMQDLVPLSSPVPTAQASAAASPVQDTPSSSKSSGTPRSLSAASKLRLASSLPNLSSSTTPTSTTLKSHSAHRRPRLSDPAHIHNHRSTSSLPSHASPTHHAWSLSTSRRQLILKSMDQATKESSPIQLSPTKSWKDGIVVVKKQHKLPTSLPLTTEESKAGVPNQKTNTKRSSKSPTRRRTVSSSKAAPQEQEQAPPPPLLQENKKDSPRINNNKKTAPSPRVKRKKSTKSNSKESLSNSNPELSMAKTSKRKSLVKARSHSELKSTKTKETSNPEPPKPLSSKRKSLVKTRSHSELKSTKTTKDSNNPEQPSKPLSSKRKSLVKTSSHSEVTRKKSVVKKTNSNPELMADKKEATSKKKSVVGKTKSNPELVVSPKQQKSDAKTSSMAKDDEKSSKPELTRKLSKKKSLVKKKSKQDLTKNSPRKDKDQETTKLIDSLAMEEQNREEYDPAIALLLGHDDSKAVVGIDAPAVGEETSGEAPKKSSRRKVVLKKKTILVKKKRKKKRPVEEGGERETSMQDMTEPVGGMNAEVKPATASKLDSGKSEEQARQAGAITASPTTMHHGAQPHPLLSPVNPFRKSRATGGKSKEPPRKNSKTSLQTALKSSSSHSAKTKRRSTSKKKPSEDHPSSPVRHSPVSPRTRNRISIQELRKRAQQKEQATKHRKSKRKPSKTNKESGNLLEELVQPPLTGPVEENLSELHPKEDPRPIVAPREEQKSDGAKTITITTAATPFDHTDSTILVASSEGSESKKLDSSLQSSASTSSRDAPEKKRLSFSSHLQALIETESTAGIQSSGPESSIPRSSFSSETVPSSSHVDSQMASPSTAKTEPTTPSARSSKVLGTTLKEHSHEAADIQAENEGIIKLERPFEQAAAVPKHEAQESLVSSDSGSGLPGRVDSPNRKSNASRVWENIGTPPLAYKRKPEKSPSVTGIQSVSTEQAVRLPPVSPKTSAVPPSPPPPVDVPSPAASEVRKAAFPPSPFPESSDHKQHGASSSHTAKQAAPASLGLPPRSPFPDAKASAAGAMVSPGTKVRQRSPIPVSPFGESKVNPLLTIRPSLVNRSKSFDAPLASSGSPQPRRSPLTRAKSSSSARPMGMPDLPSMHSPPQGLEGETNHSLTLQDLSKASSSHHSKKYMLSTHSKRSESGSKDTPKPFNGMDSTDTLPIRNAVRNRGVSRSRSRRAMLQHNSSMQALERMRRATAPPAATLDSDKDVTNHSSQLDGVSETAVTASAIPTPTMDINNLLRHMQIVQSLDDLAKYSGSIHGPNANMPVHQQRLLVRWGLQNALLDVGNQDREALDYFQRQYDLSDKDIDVLVEHLQLTQECNAPVQWDLIFRMVLPDANVNMEFVLEKIDPIESLVAMALEEETKDDYDMDIEEEDIRDPLDYGDLPLSSRHEATTLENRSHHLHNLLHNLTKSMHSRYSAMLSFDEDNDISTLGHSRHSAATFGTESLRLARSLAVEEGQDDDEEDINSQSVQMENDEDNDGDNDSEGDSENDEADDDDDDDDEMFEDEALLDLEEKLCNGLGFYERHGRDREVRLMGILLDIVDQWEDRPKYIQDSDESLTLRDMYGIISHLQLCEETGQRIRWDLIDSVLKGASNHEDDDEDETFHEEDDYRSEYSGSL